MEGTVVKVIAVVGQQVIMIRDYPEGSRVELVDRENLITIINEPSLSISEQVKYLYKFARSEQRRGEATC